MSLGHNIMLNVTRSSPKVTRLFNKLLTEPRHEHNIMLGHEDELSSQVDNSGSYKRNPRSSASVAIQVGWKYFIRTTFSLYYWISYEYSDNTRSVSYVSLWRD